MGRVADSCSETGEGGLVIVDYNDADASVI